MSGMAMAVAGSHRPGSGGDHEIMHAIDQLFPGTAGHGELAGVGALFAAYLRDDPVQAELISGCLARHGLPVTPGDIGMSVGRIRPGRHFGPKPGRDGTRSWNASACRRLRQRSELRSMSGPTLAELRAGTAVGRHRPAERRALGRPPVHAQVLAMGDLGVRQAGLVAERGHRGVHRLRRGGRRGGGVRWVWTAIAGAILIQAYLLFDCSDGELARWSKRTSASGVFLDLIGHYLGESALLVGLGIRAQGHFALSGRYVSAGLAAALLAAIVKAETDNVVVARAKAGLPGTHADAALAPRSGGLALARRLASVLRLHRITQAVELLAADPGGGDRRRGSRRPRRYPGAGRRVPGGRRGDGPRAPGGDPRIKAAEVKLSCVILTMGTRPAELERAVASALALERTCAGGEVEVVLVGNGADVPRCRPAW